MAAPPPKIMFSHGSFEKVVSDFVRPHWLIAKATGDRLRVGARAGPGNAVEIGKVRIYYSDISARTQEDAARGFILRCAMHPYTIKYYVVGWTVKLNQVVNGLRGRGARHLQADQPIVVSSRRKGDGS